MSKLNNNNFKQLTAKEIIEILKENTDVKTFCQEDWYLNAPKEFEFSIGIKNKIDAYKKAYSDWAVNSKDYDNEFFEMLKKNQELYKEMHQEYAAFLGLGNSEVVDSYIGEDMGSTYFKVHYFPAHNVYLEVSGWYQSYHGVNFEDWDDAVKEVKPKQVTITKYEVI